MDVSDVLQTLESLYAQRAERRAEIERIDSEIRVQKAALSEYEKEAASAMVKAMPIRLNRRERSVFLQRRRDGKTYRAIAKQEGLSLGRVSAIYQKALRIIHHPRYDPTDEEILGIK